MYLCDLNKAAGLLFGHNLLPFSKKIITHGGKEKKDRTLFGSQPARVQTSATLILYFAAKGAKKSLAFCRPAFAPHDDSGGKRMVLPELLIALGNETTGY